MSDSASSAFAIACLSAPVLLHEGVSGFRYRKVPGFAPATCQWQSSQAAAPAREPAQQLCREALGGAIKPRRAKQPCVHPHSPAPALWRQALRELLLPKVSQQVREGD